MPEVRLRSSKALGFCCEPCARPKEMVGKARMKAGSGGIVLTVLGEREVDGVGF